MKVLIFGATGMVGQGTLRECLLDAGVTRVVTVGRAATGQKHPRLRELVARDLYDLSPLSSQLEGFDACFFTLGTTAAGKTEAEYSRVTYDLTLSIARTLLPLNPAMTFIYVSGSGTDSTERGRVMWARVKGKTENDLKKLPFRQEFNFRPGFMKAAPGAKNTLKLYKYFSWLYPILKLIVPNSVSTIAQVGQAMINVTLLGYEKNILEVKDIKAAAALEG